jgi:hypothetical protein
MMKQIARMAKISSVVLTVCSLWACSKVGPGLANHPLDCAVGIAWADCLPGTAGYNRGGGQQTRAEEAAKQAAVITEQMRSDAAQCTSDMQSPDLDPIRHKIELYRASVDSPPPFEIASNDTFPTNSERPAIGKWATIRDECIKRSNAVQYPPSATPLQIANIQQDRSFAHETAARVGELVVALYQAKLTYAEFAQKRYEIGRTQAAAELQFRAAALIADHDRQVQGQQLAQQQFQNNLIAWSAYMQAVNARQPQAVRLDGNVRIKTNCISQDLGALVSTNCN